MPSHRLSRRHFLATASGAALSSCGTPIPYRGDPYIKRQHRDDIIVDSHCHVFNGRDIDIAAYALALTREKGGLVGYAVLREVVAAYLVAMRELAPCISEELEMAQSVVKAVQHLPYHSDERRNYVRRELVKVFGTRSKEPGACGPNINSTKSSELTNILFFGARNFGTRRGKKIIEKFEEALHDSGGIGKGDITDQVKQMLRQVDKEAGYLLAHFVNYRTVNAFELWRQFAHSFEQQNVDLFVAASLDMNSWLCASRKYSTGYNDAGHRSYMGLQVELMEQIAILFGGDIMPMSGWCPRFAAEVQNGFFRLKYKWMPHPLDTFKDAVLKRGHLGAKLYPPMGFRPYLNTELDHEKKGRAFDGMDTPGSKAAFPQGLGKCLDEELAKFYHWCAQENVPVMAHTGPSHGARIGYAERANPEYWKSVLEQPGAEHPRALGHGGLRVNLAHLGCWHADSFWERLTGGSDNSRWGDAIMHMAAKYPHLYSDMADMTDIGEEGWAEKFDSAFTRWNAYAATSKSNRASRKLMYGTDWFVMAQADLFREDDDAMKQEPPDLSKRVGRTYHLRWAEYLRQQGEKHHYDSADIMGHNAMRYLGMDTQRGRDRVDAFFDRHDMAHPVWRQKLQHKVDAGTI